MGEVVKEKPVKKPPAENAPAKPEVVAKPAAPTTIARPWRPYELMRRLFEWDPFAAIMPRWLEREPEMYAPEFSVKENVESFIFTADVPGVEANELDISLVRNRLTVSGHREEEKKEEGETCYTLERKFGSFRRMFTLPDGADLGKVSAELKDGVLTIVVPKLPEAQAQS